MEYFYIAYTKKIQEQNYFFVKRYMRFPELQNSADILDGYGMHTDFEKACSIAGITNPSVKEYLWNQAEPEISSARVIPMILHRPQPASRLVWPNFQFRGFTFAKLRLRF